MESNGNKQIYVKKLQKTQNIFEQMPMKFISSE